MRFASSTSSTSRPCSGISAPSRAPAATRSSPPSATNGRHDSPRGRGRTGGRGVARGLARARGSAPRLLPARTRGARRVWMLGAVGEAVDKVTGRRGAAHRRADSRTSRGPGCPRPGSRPRRAAGAGSGRQPRRVAGLDGGAHRRRHPGGVLGTGDRAGEQHPVAAQLHRQGGVRGGADARRRGSPARSERSAMICTL